MDTRIRISGLALVIAWQVTALAFADQPDERRERFLAAESALDAGDTETFNRLKQQLVDYPLYGYLEYGQLQRRLDDAKPAEVRAFLDLYADQPIGPRLRSSWLHKLGKRKEWDTYLDFYEPQGSTTLQCYEVRARLARADRQLALRDALKLWLVGHSQPAACDAAFDQLYASNLLTSISGSASGLHSPTRNPAWRVFSPGACRPMTVSG